MRTSPYLTLTWAWVAAVGLLAGSAAAEVSFARKPSVTRQGDQATVAFALSAPTDVEVAVVDKDGTVVRHLAAGVLGGPNPPPEPLKPGLAQEIFWDGKDDQGKQAAGARGQVSGGAASPKPEPQTPNPLSIRVRAGMGVQFGRIIGTSPYTGTLAGFDMVAVAADGTLYVKRGSTIRSGDSWELSRYDKSGKYLKTLLPYAPSTDPARTPGFRLLDAGDGLLTPACRAALDPVLLDFGGAIHRTLVNGAVVFIDNSKAALTFFTVDGSNAVRIVPMRTSKEKLKWSNFLIPQIAFSPDGRYAYYSNLASTPTRTKTPAEINPLFPQGRVYRHDLTKPGTDPEKFYDLELPDWEKSKHWLPNAWNKKSAAVGIDVDAQGNLFVCDLVNQEVVQISPLGKKLAATKAPSPDKVLVCSKTEAIYVLSSPISESGVGYGRPPSELLKLDGRGADAKVVARLVLKGAQGQSLALDESGDKPVLWVGGHQELLRIEDRGTNFVVAGASLLNSDTNAVNAVIYGAVDAAADLVYISGASSAVWRYNGETGEGVRAPFNAVDLAIGPGGMIYAWGSGGYHGPVTRYDRNFRPAPLAATGRHVYGAPKDPAYTLHGRMGRGFSVAGLDVDPRGWVYAAHGVNAALVQVFDAEGKLVEFPRRALKFGRGNAPEGGMPALVSGIVDQSGSVRVDAQGNTYVLQIGMPQGHIPPKGFEKDPSYLGAVGTIYKLAPGGGEFERKDKKLQPATGLLRSYSTPCGTISGGIGGGACHCTKPRFDVDEYGRLYIPNTFTYQVAVVDNADNLILSFGGYGNWDAQGPKSSEPKPEIPLGWPILAGASDKHIFVGDVLNHRVVRADKTWGAEALCEVR